MLAANISAAERIYKDFPDCAMLRRHPAPPPSNFDPLVKAAKQQGEETILLRFVLLKHNITKINDRFHPGD